MRDNYSFSCCCFEVRGKTEMIHMNEVGRMSPFGINVVLTRCCSSSMLWLIFVSCGVMTSFTSWVVQCDLTVINWVFFQIGSVSTGSVQSHFFSVKMKFASFVSENRLDPHELKVQSVLIDEASKRHLHRENWVWTESVELNRFRRILNSLPF